MDGGILFFRRCHFIKEDLLYSVGLYMFIQKYGRKNTFIFLDNVISEGQTCYTVVGNIFSFKKENMDGGIL